LSSKTKARDEQTDGWTDRRTDRVKRFMPPFISRIMSVELSPKYYGIG